MRSKIFFFNSKINVKSTLVDTLEFYSRENVSYATIVVRDSTFIIS